VKIIVNIHTTASTEGNKTTVYKSGVDCGTRNKTKEIKMCGILKLNMRCNRVNRVIKT